MPNALFYFENLLDQATITVSAEDSDFPKENVQDRDRHTPAKPPNTSDWYFDIDCGSAQTANRIIIANDNAYGQTAGLKVIVDTADSPSFSSPVYLVGGAGSGHAATADDQPYWYEEFASRTKRYWRIYYDSIDSTALAIGFMMLTVEVDPARHPGGEFEYSDDDQTAIEQGKGFVSAVNWGTRRDFIGLDFKKISKTLLDNLLAGYDTVRGKARPWFYANEFGTLYHVRFAGAIARKHRYLNLWDARMALKEEP